MIDPALSIICFYSHLFYTPPAPLKGGIVRFDRLCNSIRRIKQQMRLLFMKSEKAHHGFPFPAIFTQESFNVTVRLKTG